MKTALAGRLPARGVMRWLLRAPIWLYRAGLGGLLGGRFLLLTHTGRKSGLPRQTVLEVVIREREDGSYVVASGWGESSDWLRNISHTPAVSIQVGRRTCPALAERVAPDEAGRLLAAYAQEHPLAFRILVKQMLGHALDSSAADHAALARLPLVRFRPQTTER